MTAPRLVVFDVDGTLIDSQGAIVACMQAAFAAIGEEAPATGAILSIVGLSLPEAMAVLAPELPAETRSEAVRCYKQSAVGLRGIESASPLYPGALAALDLLAANPSVRLGVATGKARRGLDHSFDVHRLHPFFVTTQTADNHPSKPDPSMLLAALSETGCSADRAVMVGDTEFDVAMGRAAGFATVGVTWGYHPSTRLRRAGAHVVIDAFYELHGALEELWSRAT
jgi:phosphoglycolate phosphatase